MKRWTDDEIRFFLKNCETRSLEQLSRLLKRSEHSVDMMCRKVRLLRDHGYPLSIANLHIGEGALRLQILKRK